MRAEPIDGSDTIVRAPQESPCGYLSFEQPNYEELASCLLVMCFNGMPSIFCPPCVHATLGPQGFYSFVDEKTTSSVAGRRYESPSHAAEKERLISISFLLR